MKQIKINYTEKEFKSLTQIHDPKINEIVIAFYRDKKTEKVTYKTVIINSGDYEIHNPYDFSRLSNFWEWTEIKKDGSLGKTRNGYGCFKKPPISFFNVEIKVERLITVKPTL